MLSGTEGLLEILGLEVMKESVRASTRLESWRERVKIGVLRTKCTPIMSYGLECFQLGKADLHSLDFTFNGLCMKLFKTGSTDVEKDCQNHFAIDLPSSVFKKRQDKFILRYKSTANNSFAHFVLICNT